jgi:predicted nuclease with TOPRIM domain
MLKKQNNGLIDRISSLEVKNQLLEEQIKKLENEIEDLKKEIKEGRESLDRLMETMRIRL